MRQVRFISLQADTRYSNKDVNENLRVLQEQGYKIIDIKLSVDLVMIIFDSKTD